MAGFDFKKSSRLLAGHEFDRVFRQSSLRVSHRLVLVLASPNDYCRPRLGLVIAKKHIRRATERNRVKRHLRETFRLMQHQLPAVDAIVLARGPLDQLTDQALRELFEQQWRRLIESQRKQRQTAKPAATQPPHTTHTSS